LGSGTRACCTGETRQRITKRFTAITQPLIAKRMRA